MNARVLRFVALFPLVLSCGGSASPANDAASTKAEKQSPTTGAKVFKRECAGCHGSEGHGLGGTPEVMGPTALPLNGIGGDAGPFRTAQDVFDYVKKEMPLPKNKVGSLSDDEYWAVVEYMLASKGKVSPGLSAENAADMVVNE